MKNELNKYFFQYKDIYGSKIYIDNNLNNYISDSDINTSRNFSLELSGNTKSNLIFLEELLFIDNSIDYNLVIDKSKNLFKKILKAINIGLSDICLMRIKRFSHLNIDSAINNEINNQINNSNSNLIVSLGSNFLRRNKKIIDIRNENFKYKSFDLIYTYHPMDLIKNSNLKRYVWEDFKYIKNNYL